MTLLSAWDYFPNPVQTFCRIVFDFFQNAHIHEYIHFFSIVFFHSSFCSFHINQFYVNDFFYYFANNLLICTKYQKKKLKNLKSEKNQVTALAVVASRVSAVCRSLFFFFYYVFTHTHSTEHQFISLQHIMNVYVREHIFFLRNIFSIYFIRRPIFLLPFFLTRLDINKNILLCS